MDIATIVFLALALVAVAGSSGDAGYPQHRLLGAAADCELWDDCAALSDPGNLHCTGTGNSICRAIMVLFLFVIMVLARTGRR